MLDRVRILTPIVVGSIALALFLSPAVGIPPTTPIWIVNGVVLAIGATLIGRLVRSGIPSRAAHLVAMLLMWLAPATTLAALADTHTPSLLSLLLLEILACSFHLATRTMLVGLSAIVAAWIPIGTRFSDFGFQLSAVFTAVVLTIVLHRVMLRSLILAETRRIEQARIAQTLATELEERKRVESDRASMADQLAHAQRLEAVGTLAAGVAHDMNNVLAGIMSYADLIHLDTAEPNVAADCRSIIEAAQRGAELTRSLLGFSRRGHYRREPCLLEPIIAEMSGLLERTLPKAIVVEHVRGDDVVVDVDRVQLGQVIMNLCINASDAMNGAGRLVVSRCTATPSDEVCKRHGAQASPHAVISVVDGGHGMSEEVCARIFEPFFTTKPLGKGTGLGLSMVYGVVRAHGGIVDVQSEVGQGTRFDIYLPLTTATPTAPEVTSASGSGRIVRNRVALVVDDEALVRTSTARILKNLGFTTLAASDGVEALALFRQQEVSIVILDMAMPGMGGVECFRKLREISQVPILIASGYAAERETQELLSNDATAFLDKPFSRAQLEQQVVQLLQVVQQLQSSSPRVR
jgi:signal transduction histidine kinase/ActR/RegA family two-component response regulator